MYMYGVHVHVHVITTCTVCMYMYMSMHMYIVHGQYNACIKRNKCLKSKKFMGSKKSWAVIFVSSPNILVGETLLWSKNNFGPKHFSVE